MSHYEFSARAKSVCYNILETFEMSKPHLHERDENVIKNLILTKAKKRARKESTPISDILDSSCMEILGTASLSIKRDPLLQAIRRETHKKWPALPTKVDDFDTNKIPILLKTKDQFLLFDVRQINNNEIIRLTCFGSIRELKILSLCEDIFIDGTFKCVPKIFYQLVYN
jgi:hypothetical protein